MAHTFRITKTRKKPTAQTQGGKSLKSTPVAAKPAKRLVVSAISKTPITVTPVYGDKPQPVKKGQKPTEPIVQPPKTQHTMPVPATATASAPARRRPGRPRKEPESPPAPQAPARGRPRRIDNTRLLEEVAQVRSPRVPLAANRIVEQLESLLARGQVETFRGRKKTAPLVLSKLEEQALREALTLFQMKVILQRGGSLRRVYAS